MGLYQDLIPVKHEYLKKKKVKPLLPRNAFIILTHLSENIQNTYYADRKIR